MQPQASPPVRAPGSPLLRPAIALMNRLRYPQKFALITLLFALPLGLATWYMIREASVRIDFGQKELYGTAYLRPLRRMIEHLPEARRLAAEYAAGRAEERPELVRKHAELEADCAAVAALDSRYGAQLNSRLRWTALAENWRFIRIKSQDLDARVEDRLYADLLAEVAALFAHVGDTSNLILDPDLDSYYVMDTMLLKLPEGQVLLAEARQLGAALLAKGGKLGPEERVAWIQKLELIRSNLAKTSAGLGVAFANNPAGNLKPSLLKPLEELAAATTAFTEAVNLRVLDGGGGEPLTRAEFDALATRALAVSFDVWDLSTAQLDRLLTDRIRGFRDELRFALAVLVVALTVVFYLFLGFNRGVMSTIGSLEDAARRMVGGDMKSTFTLDTRDELGQVASSFNSVASRLREEWQQARDESARARAAEAQVREGEERLRLLVDNALDAVVTMDAEGRVTGWNAQAEAIFGRPRAEVLGKDLAEIIVPPEHREAHRRGLRTFLEKGRGSFVNQRVEIRALRRNGQEFPIELAISPLKAGGRFSFSAFVRDITARKQAEQALKQQTTLVKLLQEIAVAANEAATVEHALQFGVDKICAAMSWPIGHACVRPPNGAEELVCARVWHVPDGGAYDELRRLTETTVFERRRGEEALRVAMDATEAANRAKSAFLANMSHELRTPLNAILGYSEMLQEDAEENGHASYLGDLTKIRTAGKHLLALINDILDL
ncbi:MAG: PAS domain S-box protein, partial [Planctomycetes bacterium]|nr:PAS domain S-box protein [Planctomycetota bacterium]